jgi:hypothetical protein
MSDQIPSTNQERPENTSELLDERRAAFEAHLQKLRVEMASTSAEMSAQLERLGKPRESGPMYAEIRRYSGLGVDLLFDLIEEHRADVEGLMRTIPGFVSYSLFRTVDGGAAFTVCHSEAGADQSARIAHDWIASNAAALGTRDPEITKGHIVVHLS